MSRRSRKNSSSDDAAQLVAAVVFVLFVSGIAQRWLAIWWPLLALGAVAVLTVAAVLFRHVRAGNRAAAARQAVLDAQVASTDAMSGTAFEQLVARLLQRDGWADVRVVGGGGDLGADVTARGADGRRLVVQCKRYAPSRAVGSPDIQKFLGTVWDEHHADIAWYVTTSSFSRPATELGRRRGVVLVDRSDLATWMAGMNTRAAA